MDDRTARAIGKAARLIAEADALLITAGAGVGVDSGLPDFRGSEGFWRAYPALGRLKIPFEEMAQPQWFHERPEMAWAFYGHRQQLYRETKPHMGFSLLLDWGRAMPGGYFVVTSNVDGQFEKAGFPAERILEQHGSIHRMQCSRPCSEHIWREEPKELDIDLENITARGRLPRCPECGDVARPNVLMFVDPDWLAKVTREQEQRYRQWLASVRGRRLVIVELGAGTAIATIRMLGERLASERDRVTLVRVNPDAADSAEPVIPVRLGALEALQRIEEKLPEGFRRLSRASELSRQPRPHPAEIVGTSNGSSRENLGTAPSTQASKDLEETKWKKTYSNAWRIAVPEGSVVWVDKIDVQHTYLGMITGLAGTGYVDGAIRRAREFVRQHFHGPAPVVIPPALLDPDSDTAVLPPLRFAAQIRSWAQVNDEDEGSWMNLIWFAEIDDEKSLKAFVEEALAQVDWKTQAEGYSI